MSFFLNAQPDGSFTLELSSDTVLIGNTISISYNIENLEGEFVAPDLEDFRIVAGPNVSSQYSSFNGRVTQRSSHTYYLMPKDIGISTIGEAKILTGMEEIGLDAIRITVLDNPHGLEESFGRPLSRRQGVSNQDTLSQQQKTLLEKLKKGKRKKI
jgi:hypothetical protein